MRVRLRYTESDDIQAPVRAVTKETLRAFEIALRDLFEEYPPRFTANLKTGSGETPEKWRESAIECLNRSDRDTYEMAEDIRDALYFACDSGVPDELLEAVYGALVL